MVHYIDSFPGREITINDTKNLYFGGTSYLGVQTDAAFQKIFIKNIKKYGTNYGASRNSNIRFSLFENAESYLAILAGSEACTTLSSGYLAGQFVCSYFGQHNKVFYAPNTHSALFQSEVKPYATFTALNSALREFLFSGHNVTPVVFVDSIDFSGTNYPHFENLKSLPLKELILVVDDSHGIGVVGLEGGGIFRMLDLLQPKELIVCCSLGKSFGVQAGAVFGSEQRIKDMKITDFFGGASPTSPANLATILEAEPIYKKKRKHLKRNIGIFTEKIVDLKRFSYMENHPTFSYFDKSLTNYLLENRVIVTSFGYPKEDDSLMSRIVLSAAHTKEDIYYLVKMLNSY